MAPLEPIQNLLYVSPKNVKSNPMSKPALPPHVKSSVPGKPPLKGPSSSLNGMLVTVYDGRSPAPATLRSADDPAGFSEAEGAGPAGSTAVSLRLSDATDSTHP